MTKQKQKQKQKQKEEEEEEQGDMVREWEEGLPSLADLISLSQCLISPQLASAFSITSPSPLPTPSPADVALASRTAFSSLRCTSHAYPDLLGKDLRPQPHAGDRTLSCVEEPQLNGGALTFHGAEASGGLSVRERHRNSQPANAGHLRSYGDASVGKYHVRSAPLDSYGGGDVKASESGRDGDDEGEGGHASGNAGPCISDSSDVGTRLDADNEAEESESTPLPAENPNAEATARTLKRPRLVWTPELHKRFADAVSHLGVKTAVPKTIMQLMNVEGLTRENVASHLQKYRLYLKRMQGLSNEGPTSSDLLFASTPVPAGLATPGRFHAGMPAHLQDINQVPFAPTLNPVSMGRGHVAGIMSGPLPPMDPFSFNIFARPPSHRFVQGDVQGFRQYQSASLQKK